MSLDNVSKELHSFAQADTCLLSMNGLLDCLFVARNVIGYVYDTMELQ